MMKSWRTTALGCMTIVAGVIHAAMPYLQGQPVDSLALITAITAGIGLIQARDNVVTSEAAGAK